MECRWIGRRRQQEMLYEPQVPDGLEDAAQGVEEEISHLFWGRGFCNGLDLLMSSVLLAYVAGVVSPPRAGARRPEKLGHLSSTQRLLGGNVKISGIRMRSWLSAEQLVSLSMRELEDSTSDEAKAYVSALVKKSGKSDLYLDILFFLSQKSSRSGGIPNFEVRRAALRRSRCAIAEGAAATYLAAFGAVNTSLLHSSLPSTRSLQRFLDEQWMHYNFNSVAEIYEDRILV